MTLISLLEITGLICLLVVFNVISGTTVINCPQYTTSNTNFGTKNVVKCTFQACDAVFVTNCFGVTGSVCVADTVVALYNSAGQQVAFNDDSCGSKCSGFNYFKTGCDTYTLWQGCYSTESCSGKFSITTGFAPTIAPTPPVHICPPYYATKTFYDTINTVPCSFELCHQSVTVTNCASISGGIYT